MLDRLEHVGVMVADIDRSIRYYTNVLGLALRERRHLGNVELAFIEVGDTLIELIQGSPDFTAADGLVHHVAFTVADLDAEIARLRAAGVEFLSAEPIPVWGTVRVIFFRGPDGEKLELFGPGPVA